MNNLGARESVVSVVIPAYNCEATIDRAIRSALAQEAVGLQIIVADDGSTDQTKQVVEKNGESVIYLYQENAGPAAGRNLALSKCTGKYVTFLDADDEWLPGRVKKCIEPMENDEEVGLTYCWSIRRCWDGREKIRNLKSVNRNRMHLILWPDPIMSTPAITCRKSVLDKVGVFDETLGSREDHDLWIRVGEVSKTVEIPDPLVIVHESTRGYTFTNRLRLDSLRSDYFKIIEKAFERLPERYGRQLSEIHAEAYRYWGLYALYYGFTKDARSDLLRSLRSYPSLKTLVFWLLSNFPEVVLNRLRKIYKV